MRKKLKEKWRRKETTRFGEELKKKGEKLQEAVVNKENRNKGRKTDKENALSK